jgi:hypothetical protein
MNRSHTARPRSYKLHRGSKKRLRRISIADHSPARFWIYAAFVLTLLALLFRFLTACQPTL